MPSRLVRKRGIITGKRNPQTTRRPSAHAMAVMRRERYQDGLRAEIERVRIAILDIHFKHPKTNADFQEWARLKDYEEKLHDALADS